MTPEELKKIMEDNNLTYIQMANKLGVSRRTIYYWRQGYGIPLAMERLIRLTFKIRA